MAQRDDLEVETARDRATPRSVANWEISTDTIALGAFRSAPTSLTAPIPTDFSGRHSVGVTL